MEEKQPHRISPEEKPQGKLIEKVRSFFQWITTRVSPRPKITEATAEQEKQKAHLLSRYPLPELISGGQRSIVKLERARNAFLDRAGAAGEAFVSRHVDPVIRALQDFVLSLQENKETPLQPRTGMKGALGTVELIALARDEHRPWKKIRESTEYQARQALLEDITFVMAYPAELLAHMGIVGQEQAITLKQIEDALHPVLLKYEKLLAKHPHDEDFYTLYHWRTTLDIERQQLHDTALKGIEEYLAPFKLKFSIRDTSFFWLSQPLETITFDQLYEAFQYIFELVKTNEHMRLDERVLRFFSGCKEHLHTLVHLQEEPSKEEKMRLIQTVRLIEELIGIAEES